MTCVDGNTRHQFRGRTWITASVETHAACIREGCDALNPRYKRTYPMLLGLPMLKRPDGTGPTELLMLWLYSPHGPVKVVCFCAKSRRRKDGSCRWTDHMLARLRPWYRSRAVVEHDGPADRAEAA